MKKVSVIIPVYNCETYLMDCLISICTQTYSKIEIIVVDDGSNDRSPEIIQKAAKSDDRIVMHFIENRGVSHARNLAINGASGEYIAFVDADDIVAVDFIETLVRTLESESADMAAVGVAKHSTFNQTYFTKGDIQTFVGNEVFEQLFGLYEGFLCNKLYKTDVLRTYALRLDENVSVCEDMLFNVQYLISCERVAYYSGKKYFYRQNPSSATNKLDNLKWFSAMKAYKEILLLLKDKPEGYQVALRRYAMFLASAKYRVHFVDSREREKIRQEVSAEWKRIMPECKKFTVKQRAKLCLLNCMPRLVLLYQRRKLMINYKKQRF